MKLAHNTINSPETQFTCNQWLVAVVWLVAVSLMFVILWPSMDHTLQWDEVDYVLATRQGYIANATDQSAFSASDFLRFTMAKFKGTEVPEISNYNEDYDVFSLRHTHPPLLQYIIGLLGKSQLNPGNEISLRLVQFGGSAILIATMLWGYITIAGTVSFAGLITVASAGVLCGFLLGRELNCHLWIAVSLMFTCISVGKFMAIPSRNRGILAGCCIGLNFLGLQTGVFVAFWAVLAVGLSILLPAHENDNSTGFQARKKLVTWFVRSVWMLFGFLGFIMITYPGALFRLSLVRIFALYAYIIMKGNEYSDVTSRYEGFLAITYPILILGFFGLASLFFLKRTQQWYLAASTAIIGFGYGIVLLKFLLNITYITPALSLLAALGTATVTSFRIKPVEIVMAVGMIAFVGYQLRTYPADANYGTISDFERVIETIGPRESLVEGAHVLQYYIPEKADQLISITISGDRKSLTRRNLKRLQYEDVPMEELAGRVVVLRMFNGLAPYEWEKQLPPEARKLEIPGMLGSIYEFPETLIKRSSTAASSESNPK